MAVRTGTIGYGPNVAQNSESSARVAKKKQIHCVEILSESLQALNLIDLYL